MLAGQHVRKHRGREGDLDSGDQADDEASADAGKEAEDREERTAVMRSLEAGAAASGSADSKGDSEAADGEAAGGSPVASARLCLVAPQLVGVLLALPTGDGVALPREDRAIRLAGVEPYVACVAALQAASLSPDRTIAGTYTQYLGSGAKCTPFLRRGMAWKAVKRMAALVAATRAASPALLALKTATRLGDALQAVGQMDGKDNAGAAAAVARVGAGVSRALRAVTAGLGSAGGVAGVVTAAGWAADLCGLATDHREQLVAASGRLLAAAAAAASAAQGLSLADMQALLPS